MNRRSLDSAIQLKSLGPSAGRRPVKGIRLSAEPSKSPWQHPDTSVGEHGNPFSLGETENLQKEITRQTDENQQLCREVERLRKDMDSESELLNAKLLSLRCETMTSVYPALRDVYRASLDAQSEEARQKNELFSLKLAVRELKHRIENTKNENEELKREIERMEEMYIDVPASQPRSYSAIYQRIWAGALKTSERKEAVRKRASGPTRRGVEKWVEGLNTGLDKREVTKAIEKAVRGKEFSGERFWTILQRFQPYPLDEDVLPILNQLRIRCAVSDYPRLRLVAELSTSSADIDKTQSLLRAPPFALSDAEVATFLSFITNNSEKTCSDLLASLPEWPLLCDITRFLQHLLMTRQKTIDSVRDFVPAPFSLSAFCHLLQKEFSLTQDAALILATAVSTQRPSITFKELLSEYVFDKAWDYEGVTKDVMRRLTLETFELIVAKTGKFSEGNFRLTALISGVVGIGTGDLRLLSDFTKGLEDALDSRLCDRERLAFECYCFSRARLLYAVEVEALRNYLKKLIFDLDLSPIYVVPKRPVFDEQVDSKDQ